MHRPLLAWTILCLALAAALVAAGVALGRGDLPPHEQGAAAVVSGCGAALAVLALVVAFAGRPASRLLTAADPDRPLHVRHPWATLFLASFVILFVEVMFIRYCASQIRVFSFYKNVPLIGCFLGLGLGCCLGEGRGRHALGFLLWMVPMAVFLSGGSLVIEDLLGRLASASSSELILGDQVTVDTDPALAAVGHVLMGLFCVATLVAITLLFALLGRLLGAAFEPVPRLTAYTINIAGSLAGILGFIALSFFQTPPWVWFAAGLGPLLWWTSRRGPVLAGAALVVAGAAAVTPSLGRTVWSPYQKLVGHELPPGAAGNPTPRPAYLVQISGVFYQEAMDLRPESVAGLETHPYPHYDAAFAGLPRPRRVLVVGAGTGNDVAAALRAGAERVDAVDIDPAIVAMGRAHHPERPYDDPRVHVIVDDARAAFRKLPAGTYDAVVFGLLDSHTQLGMSSVRLDNYVFTLESFAAARRLLKPGGHLVVTAATFRDWFRARLITMLEATGDGPVQHAAYGAWHTYVSRVDEPARPAGAASSAAGSVPSDDWPFLYLPRRGVPVAYIVMVAMLAAASVVVLRAGGLRTGRFQGYHAHLFFLGAAFLLMEVYAINRLALLFGTTWVVSAVTIACVLVLIVCANAAVALLPRIPYAVAYVALVAALLLSWSVDPAAVLGRGTAVAVAYGLLVLSPVFFSGLVFARSFRAATLAGPAIGANILGSVLGGWVEYATMATGIRAMVLLALAFYVCSMVPVVLAARRGGVRDAVPAPA
ncbi:MAG: spermidine synthase [Planctomycetota bacterium]